MLQFFLKASLTLYRRPLEERNLTTRGTSGTTDFACKYGADRYIVAHVLKRNIKQKSKTDGTQVE